MNCESNSRFHLHGNESYNDLQYSPVLYIVHLIALADTRLKRSFPFAVAILTTKWRILAHLIWLLIRAWSLACLGSEVTITGTPLQRTLQILSPWAHIFHLLNNLDQVSWFQVFVSYSSSVICMQLLRPWSSLVWPRPFARWLVGGAKGEGGKRVWWLWTGFHFIMECNYLTYYVILRVTLCARSPYI